MIDLQLPAFDMNSFLVELRALDPTIRTIAFGAHVDVKALKAARAAGCDIVKPRSQFVAELEAELPKWFVSPVEAPVESVP